VRIETISLSLICHINIMLQSFTSSAGHLACTPPGIAGEALSDKHLRASPNDLFGDMSATASKGQSEGRNGKDDQGNGTRDQTTNLGQGWENHHSAIDPLTLLSSWLILRP
jgi:hypothetical protein